MLSITSSLARHHRILTRFYHLKETPASIAENSCAYRSEGAAYAILAVLAIAVLPDETLKDREALTACLTEEFTSMSRMLADILDENWVKGWENAMGVKFIDLPGIQN